jgi:glycosyltransferase involved in cell wall biosynthesis
MTPQRHIVVCATVPKDSGTFSFYRNLRKGLAEEGFDVRCVSVGRDEARKTIATFVDDGCVALDPGEAYVKRQAAAFSEWCEKASADVVIPLNSVAALSAVPHLPPSVRVVSRCANSFDHGYRITAMNSGRLARVVATTPRQVEDLTADYGLHTERVSLVPNGVDLGRFATAATVVRGISDRLTVGFLGRLEHRQKGVLFLPSIAGELDRLQIPFRLTIAGHGVHQNALERRLAKCIDRGDVELSGPLDRNDVPEFLSNVDVLVFPSQFEGCPNVLLEAMAAGCVPVATRLPGITDWIVDDCGSGFLVPVGDSRSFADRIRRLHEDRKMVRSMSSRSHAVTESRFSLEGMIAGYLEIFRSLQKVSPSEMKARPWSEFQLDREFQTPGWKRLVPVPLRVALKRARYHLGWSDRYE